MTVFGPASETLIDTVSPDNLAMVLRQLMSEWREWITETELIHQRTYQGHMIITMCRCLFLNRTGMIASKRDAIAWAERELPQWSSLIGQALVWREAKGDDRIDHDAMLPETMRFVHFAIDTIVRA
jgi:aminoglycoside adenylyltransferase-like protein